MLDPGVGGAFCDLSREESPMNKRDEPSIRTKKATKKKSKKNPEKMEFGKKPGGKKSNQNRKRVEIRITSSQKTKKRVIGKELGKKRNLREQSQSGAQRTLFLSVFQWILRDFLFAG